MTAPAQNIVINEIMYHPASQDVREEFVELFNAGPTNVNLSGWTLSGGIAYTFPNTTLAAGGYLVVAADLEIFSGLYPLVANAIGGWLTATSTNVNSRVFVNYAPVLSNTRNSVNLNNAAGTRIDEVTYADSGDWGVRRRGLNDAGYRGWTWYAEHDGLGKSLELINPALPNEHGQNWGSSAPAGGTPGTANSIRSTNIAPLIVGVQHLPVIPRSTDNISINARILNESASGLTVTLRWRVDGAASFSSTNMLDNGMSGDGVAGDGIYGAVLDAKANNTIIEFYIEAADAQANTRTWPAPAMPAADFGGTSGQIANALLQVDNSTQLTNSAPLYKLILTAAEWGTLGLAFSNAPSSDAEMNCTFLSIDAGSIDRIYFCSTRNRGHGSRQGNPHNYRINFPSDTPWKGVAGFNMNARTVPAQVVGAAVAQKAGAAGNNSRFARLRVNNSTGPGGSPTDGLYAANEDIGSDWTDRQFPNNGGGNIYSVVRDIAPKEFNYRGEDPVAYQNTYFKQSNASENDWRDLIGMLQVMGDNQTGSFTLGTAQQVANVEQWLVHLAVMNLMGNNESGINTGNNDDYYWYRGINDPRFIMVYHDLDTVLSQTLFGAKAADDPTVFSATTCCASGDTVGIAAAMNFFMHHPQVEPLYYRTLQNLLDGPFSAAQFNSVVDQVLADFPHLAGTASAMKGWMATRRSTVQGIITGLVPPATNNPVATVSGEPRSPTWRTTATLTVGGSNITHYQWRLNNGAWSVETPVATPISLTSVANGSTNTVQVVGRNSGGIYQSKAAPSLSKTWVVNTALPSVRLNEVMARNDSASNHFGTYPDMIELYNEGAATVTLTGMRLSNDAGTPGKYTFPATTLAAGAYLILYADSAANPGLHTGFTLNANGDDLYLFNTVASGGARLDSVAFGPQLPNLSISRFGVTGGWALAQPTFGVTNIAQALGNARGLKLNEWLAASVPPNTEDFIEIYNPDPMPVALGGMYLTDEPLGAPAMHRVADLSFVAGGSYLAFIADGSAGAGPDHLNFGLASEQGQIGLFDSALSVVDCVTYGPQRTDISSGRCPNGSSGFSAQSFPTPGTPNACSSGPAGPVALSLIAYTNVWRYESNNFDGLNWMGLGFDDSAWYSGPGVIGRTNAGSSNFKIPEPLLTQIATGSWTYYFRTRFNIPANASITSLQLTHIIDDGCIIYLNGVEIYRYNLSGSVTNSTPAIPAVNGPPTYQGPFNLPLGNLTAGTNLIAIEVHQGTNNSADVFMGLKLDGLVVTNAASAAGIVINEVLANNATAFVLDGRTPDFIELYNPSTNAVDLAGLSLNDTPNNNPPKWIFPPGSIIPARGYFLVHADGGAPASANNTGFGLGTKGGGVYLFKKAPDTNEVFDRVVFGLQTADFSIGRIPVAGTNWFLNYPTPGVTNVAATLGDPATLKLNEWMADPTGGDDWFEVFNPGTEPVLLSDLRLTDVFGNPGSYVIPALSFIGLGSNAFQRFEADDPASPLGPEHVNFKLSGAADAIYLLASNNATVIDAVSWTNAQQAGVSEGRLPDGSGFITRFPTTPTPGDANYLPLTTVVVNEILTHTDPPLEDAIELRNLTASPLPIGGWFLSDDKDSLRKFRIPTGTVLPANGYTVFYEIAFNNDTNGTPFALSSADGDQVYLAEASTNGALTGMRASAKFGPAANGVSFGRYVTSVGRVDYPAMSARSFGQDNPLTVAQFRTGTGAVNAYPKVGPVLLSEIMYHPPDLIVPGVSTNDNLIEEFIELRNTSLSPVPLYDPAHTTNGWRLRDAVDFTFTSAHTIPAGGHLLVVSFDPATNAAALAQFRAKYGSNSVLAGPYSGKLDNSSESVELTKPDSPQLDGSVPDVLVDKVIYADTLPWPANADGLGMSLQRVSDTGYGNDVTNWVAAVPTPGPFVQMDTDGDGMPDDWEMANGLNKLSNADAGLDPDLDGMTNLQEYLAGTNPQSAASVLRVTATLNPGRVDLEFTAVAGRTYTILHCPTMPSGGAWSKLVDVPAQGSTGPVIVPDGSVVGGAQRFYRIVSPAQP